MPTHKGFVKKLETLEACLPDGKPHLCTDLELVDGRTRQTLRLYGRPTTYLMDRYVRIQEEATKEELTQKVYAGTDLVGFYTVKRK